MVRATLSIRKTLEESAEAYFKTAKKAKSKLAGAKKTIERFQKELPKAAAAAVESAPRKKEWYEQFRWSLTSDGVLLVGGRDAGGNETIVKKHMEPTDTVLHTEAAGSPFFLIKGEANELRLEQAAQVCAAYSNAWKAGLGVTDVFWVKPEQVSKEANAGEYIAKGGFMVRGEKHNLTPKVILAFGVVDGRPTAGVPALFQAKGVGYAVLEPGKDKPSAVAAKLLKKFGFHTDEWIRLLPGGASSITSWKKPHNT